MLTRPALAPESPQFLQGRDPTPLKLNIVLGSTRPGRVAPVIGRWIEEAVLAQGRFDVERVDLAAFALPLLDEAGHPRAQAYQNEPAKR